ncbi:hypothetical protein CAEBREN_28376 [Caenorhabditis brenneri]|uniref:Uncharacterized protein n=1 Tax=Caenorhabditis brenneri TaxID=135651 RepID=G0PNZ9_CAEBE|nr:hypothetical protein CAEBREN_28376 [Caenorhabditis brenneri]
MKTNYNLTKGEFIYAASLYYRKNERGEKTISWPDVLFALNVVKLISICMSIVLFCGISTFRKLRTLRHTSKRTTNLQQQLFKALVTQTLIPVLTMFFPAAVMMVSPVFELTLGSYEGLIMTVITTYPCVDPMVVIFFVKDYRHAIKQTLKCRRCLYSREPYSVRATAVSFVTEAT